MSKSQTVKALAFIGMAIVGGAIFVLKLQTSEAQAPGPRPLIVADIDSVNGMQTSNPLANYPAGNPAYAGQEIQYDNEGIGIFIAPASQSTPITTDGNVPECGHLGIQGWQGGNYAYKLTDGNTWQKRRSPCAGMVVIGSSGQIRAQTLTIKGTSVEGKPFTLQVNVPDPSSWDREVGGGSRRLYVDDAGNTYSCYSSSFSRVWPNECEYSPQQALQKSPVAYGSGVVAGNGLCQYGETTENTPQDCPDTNVYSFTLNVSTPSPSVEAKAGSRSLSKFKLKNTGTSEVRYALICNNVPPQSSFTLKTYNPESTTDGLAEISFPLASNAEKDFEVSFDASTATPGVVTTTCKVRRVNAPQPDEKFATDDIVVTAGVAAQDTLPTFTLTLQFPGQYNNSKFYISLGEPDGLKEFWVTKKSGTVVYGGSPGTAGNFGACGGTNVSKNIQSSTVELLAADFPVTASIIDCRPGATAKTVSIATPPLGDPGTGAPAKFTITAASAANSYTLKIEEPETIQSYSIYSQSGTLIVKRNPSCPTSLTTDAFSAQSTDFPLKVTVMECRANAGDATYSVPQPTGTGSQVVCSDSDGGSDYLRKGTATGIYGGAAPGYHFIYGTEPNPTSGKPSPNQYTTYTDHCATATQLNEAFCDASNGKLQSIGYQCPNGCRDGVCLSGITDPGGTTTPPIGTTTPPGPPIPPGPKPCALGEKCPNGYTCNTGQMCYYPDGQLTCIAWSSTSMTSPKCPTGTSTCEPADPSKPWRANCISHFSTGQKGKYYPSGQQSGGSQYCGSALMQGYSRTKNPDGSYDMICYYMEETLPAGFSPCRADEKSCRTQGDEWTPEEEKAVGNSGMFWCAQAQRCSLKGGGGKCVGMREACPSDTLYCPQNTSFSPAASMMPIAGGCGEPDTITEIADGTRGFWCGGGSGTEFYSTSKPVRAYCPAKKTNGQNYGMLSAAEVTEILKKLGSGWQMCKPWDANCCEPGQKCSSNGWCAWMPPGSAGPTPMTSGTRVCPALDGSTGGGDDKVCGMVVTRAFNSETNECKNFPNTCIPDGWVAKDCKIKAPNPEDLPECDANYWKRPMTPIWSATGSAPAFYVPPTCRPARYHWNLSSKIWEKCEANKDYPYINVKDNPKATHTNCEAFNFEVEKEWRAERYLVHPPELTGEGYWPSWDVNGKNYRYNHKTDTFEECSVKFDTVMSPMDGQYYASCMPAPEKDRGWLLKKAQSEYRMWQEWNKGRKDGEIVPPIPEPKPVPVPLPEPGKPVPVAQCKAYFGGLRQSLVGDKKFLRDMNIQLVQIPDEYPDAANMKKLLEEAKQIVVALDKAVRASRCTAETMSDIQAKQERLQRELFPQLSGFAPDVQDFAQYQQCRAALTDRAKDLSALLGKEKVDAKARKDIKALVEDIDAQLKEFDARASEFEFDVGFSCSEYRHDIDAKVAPLIRAGDEKLEEKIVEFTDTFQPTVIAELEKQIEEQGKKLDTLLVKIAELNEAIAKVNTATDTLAATISKRLSDSVAQTTYIPNEKARTAIQSAKDRLIPLVGEFTKLIPQCVVATERDALTTRVGDVVVVNWLGEYAAEVEKRVELLTTLCKEKKLTQEDINSFATSLDELMRNNGEAAYREKLTFAPDVPTHEWYYNAYQVANKKFAVQYGRPAENTLAQDAILMLLRVAGVTDITGECQLKVPTIAKISTYAICAANRAHEKGLALPADMTVPVSRVQMVEWLVALMNLEPGEMSILDKYNDVRGLTQSQREAVAAVANSGLMVGTIVGERATFDPRGSITRAALVTIMQKESALNEEAPR